jgi:hypothetical protein
MRMSFSRRALDSAMRAAISSAYSNNNSNSSSSRKICSPAYPAHTKVRCGFARALLAHVKHVRHPQISYNKVHNGTVRTVPNTPSQESVPHKLGVQNCPTSVWLPCG